MRFGDRLKQARTDQQLTQQDVAKQLNVSRQTISSWETENSYPDIDSLIRISDFYHLSLDVLLKEDVGMKEYLRKQEVLDWIKPIYWSTIVIDAIFVGSFIFVTHAGIAGALIFLIAMINLLVMMRVNNLTERITGKAGLSQWPQRRKFVWPFVIAISLVVLIQWALKQKSLYDMSYIVIGLWLGVMVCELMYHYRKRKDIL